MTNRKSRKASSEQLQSRREILYRGGSAKVRVSTTDCWKQGVPDNVRSVMLHFTEADLPATELGNEMLRRSILRTRQAINIERLLRCGKTLRLCRNIRTLENGLVAPSFFALSDMNLGGKRKKYVKIFWWLSIEDGLSNLIQDVQDELERRLNKVTVNREAAAEAAQKEYDQAREMLLASLSERAPSSPLGGHYPLDSVPDYRRAFLWGYHQAHKDKQLSANEIAKLLGCERSVGLRLGRQVLEDRR